MLSCGRDDQRARVARVPVAGTRGSCGGCSRRPVAAPRAARCVAAAAPAIGLRGRPRRPIGSDAHAVQLDAGLAPQLLATSRRRPADRRRRRTPGVGASGNATRARRSTSVRSAVIRRRRSGDVHASTPLKPSQPIHAGMRGRRRARAPTGPLSIDARRGAGAPGAERPVARARSTGTTRDRDAGHLAVALRLPPRRRCPRRRGRRRAESRAPSLCARKRACSPSARSRLCTRYELKL